jgi:DNA-binding XRE family transcriptional regulator
MHITEDSTEHLGANSEGCKEEQTKGRNTRHRRSAAGRGVGEALQGIGAGSVSEKVTYKNSIPPLSKMYHSNSERRLSQMVITAREMSETLRKLRERARYTQEQLADYLGITAATISKIENGHRVPDALTYENWVYICIHPPKRYEFYYEGRQGQHA